MQLISPGDAIDLFFRIKERGYGYLFKKMHLRYDKIVESTWAGQYGAYNWLDIPSVRRRLNSIITGDPIIVYPNYIMHKYFAHRKELKMISLGCGSGFNEIEFARNAVFSRIDALDISRNRIMSARQKANAERITNINFMIGNVFDYALKERCYDLVLCQSFLHHCRNLQGLLEKLQISLKPDGLLVLNDYVGPKRFQWRKNQLMLVNRILNQIPFSYKIRTHSNMLKSKVYSPGILRMLLSDPSEAVESHKIMSAVHEYFRVIEEKKIGGNILHLLFKDIAHNFLGQNEKTKSLIQRIFELEDDFLKSGNESDFIFGVYKPRS